MNILRPYIVFHGIELTGKTSCIKAVEEHLTAKNYDVFVTKAIGSGPAGIALRKELLPDSVTKAVSRHSKSYEALSMAMCNMDAIENVIVPAVNQGKLVLCDRGLGCFYSYQVFANKDLKTPYVTEEEKLAKDIFDGVFKTMIAHPGLYFNFSCNLENYNKRLSTRTTNNMLDHRGFAYMERAMRGYKEYALKYSVIHEVKKGPIFKDIDANKPLKEVIDEVIDIVDTYIEQHYINPK